jgi:hypothetical protein
MNLTSLQFNSFGRTLTSTPDLSWPENISTVTGHLSDAAEMPFSGLVKVTTDGHRCLYEGVTANA